MKQRITMLAMVVIAAIHFANAQGLDKLQHLNNTAFPVYYSAGSEQRAASIAGRIEKAMSYYEQLLQFKPLITVLVLSGEDWATHTTMRLVYGMPHYDEKIKTLFLAADDNPLWKSFLPPLDKLPADLREAIKATYTDSNGLTMRPFFDLLGLHELGHAFHHQAGINMQRKWMGELFVNILLHTYIAEREPQSLPALTVFPKMVISAGVQEFKYTTLKEIEDGYENVGRNFPKNYGWYQCRWHSAAADIYNVGGKAVASKLWTALKNHKEVLSDEELISFLEEKADPSIANMVRNWDRDTRK